jgi:hypothetical protein
MPNPKRIEADGLLALRRYLNSRLHIAETALVDTRNKGRTAARLGCDLEFQHNGETYYLELKAFSSRTVPTNIRFAHQTIASFHEAGILDRLIVAIVYNLIDGVDAARFLFFRLGSVPVDAIFVEPHFLIQPRRLAALGGADESVLQDQIDAALVAQPSSLDLNSVFDSPVRKHMRWS